MPSEALQDILLALRSDFLDTLRNRCQELEVLVLRLPGSDKSSTQFEEIFRIVHSLKGAGGTHGLPLVTSICHYFEDILTSESTTTFSKEFADLTLQLIDLLHEHALQTDNAGNIAAIEIKLRSIQQANTACVGSVLVLEPSKALRLLLQQLLDELQLRAVFMHDSVQTLSRLLSEPFDLVIVSVELEVLKGPALISAVQMNQGINAHTPVLFLTSTSDFQPDGLSGVKVLARSPILAQQLGPEITALLASSSGKNEL